MKKLLAFTLAVCMSLSLAACGQKSAPASSGGAASASASTGAASEPKKEVVELKWGSVHPETQVVTQMMMRAIEEINANAEGIHITGYPNGVLGGSSDLVEGVQEGMVDIITEGPAQFASWIPKAAQVEAPFLWQSVEHMQKALNGGYKDTLNELFEDIDVRILGSFYYGTRQLTTNKPVTTLADLKGMKIRVPQSDLYIKMIESWGASATPMNINELYMALQTGTVDGQENPLTTYESYKFYEVVKNVTLTNHIICPNMIFMNGDVWNSLSDHDKEVVQNAINSAVAWQDEQILTAEQTLADDLKQYGVEVYTPDETIREATIPYIKPNIEDWDYIQSLA
ncbi:TRAP transporter substrate-binding protein DctP [Pseudoflavonifractor phocaeensis]|uniref:TRAP transporter substrate-binding protein DctP n=1 Tax=Pseudoflavonifractor phocaeensis TaxID=1870988 RepID=UPI001F248D14|nr:TRAP transporter substrate-binding protein DctP [Pseudoflavonifractor phocaeensis]MCF2661969.1 TRAP transporter substrate-binding protein DctP [Pseudoflavonifractor phocaeensis]